MASSNLKRFAFFSPFSTKKEGKKEKKKNEAKHQVNASSLSHKNGYRGLKKKLINEH